MLGELGLRCPADVSLVGFNDMPLLDRLTPPLTTVRLPQQAIGEEAAKLLLERIGEPDRAPKRLLLPCPLIVRGSTSSP